MRAVSSGPVTYSLSLLQGLGSDLHTIADVMSGVNGAVSYEPADVGHLAVHGALEHFRNNWDDRRELLTKSLHNIGSMAQGCAETFDRFDREMAAKVRTILDGSP